MPQPPCVFAWLVASLPAGLLFFFVCLSLSVCGPELGGAAPPPSLPSRLLSPPVLSPSFDCILGFLSALCCLLYLPTGFFLVVCLDCFFCTLGLVPGLSGRRLVQDFQHRPFPPFLIVCVFGSALTIWIGYL